MARSYRKTESTGDHGPQFEVDDRSEETSVDLELFGGAGGLTIGLSSAGFRPDHIFEIDRYCCATLRHNSRGSAPYITDNIHQEDVANVDWSRFNTRVRLLAGGPPCQPFSSGGKHLAHRDGRNQFPATIRAVRELRPAIVLIENVPGILRNKFEHYLGYITRQLEYPSLKPRPQESWEEHGKRLVKWQKCRYRSREYTVYRWILNVADHGIAQARVRVFIIAVRSGLPTVQEPQPTYSRAALVRYQKSGAYWHERGLPVLSREGWPRRVHGRSDGRGSRSRPWVTVRDALMGLPNASEIDLAGNNHWIIPGARVYRGHSGSELDWPAKTIKAGVHGVAGGENVLLLDTGGYRYLTLREMARLQGFPDDYYFVGPRSRVIGQIGNAVPCRLGKIIGDSLMAAFKRGGVPREG